MKVKHHIISSGMISGLIYLFTNSLSNAIASFLGGILIDLDHFIDYYMNFGFSYNLKKICDAIDNFRLSKLYLLLHSYELLITFWLAIFIIPLNSIYLFIAIGVTQHIFLDQLFNPVTPKTYFLSHRIACRFKKESFLVFHTKPTK